MADKGAFSHLDLKRVLSDAHLPALPQSAIRLLELSRNPDNGPAEFARPIESDPGLASQVLQFANSSYFGFSQEISSIALAVSLVGSHTVKNFALWNAVFSLLPDPKCGPFHLKGLWQDSLRRALFARAVASLQGMKKADEVFTAALLQDMAIPLLAKELPDLYGKLLNARNQGARRLSALERQVLGWTHAEAAGTIARQWNLPEEFAVLVEDHLAVDRGAAGPALPPAKLAVALSALLPSVTDPCWTECDVLEEHYGRLTGPGRPTLADLLARVDGEFAQFAPVLRLPMPSKSLSDGLEEALAAA
jgi:HD-like signal output (HDOD) protein